MTLSATTTVSFNIATPLSEKKLLWVNETSPTKSCKQAMTPSAATRLLATRYRLMSNVTPDPFALLLTTVVHSKAWNKTQKSRKWTNDRENKNRYYLPDREGNENEIQFVRTEKPRCSLHLVYSSWKCAPIISDPSQKTGIQPYWPPRLSHETNSTVSSHPGADRIIDKGHSHPPITTSGQKQLNPCPTSDRDATADSTKLGSSSTNFWA